MTRPLTSAALGVLTMGCTLLLACHSSTAPERPPQPPPAVVDLRFKGVGTGAIDTSDQYLGGADVEASTGSFFNLSFDSAVGSPLQFDNTLCSSTTCAWFVEAWRQGPGVQRLSYRYDARQLSTLPALLDTAVTDTVTTSLDLEPGLGALAAARVFVGHSGGYRLRSQVVPIVVADSVIGAEAAAKRVVTAVAFDSGQVLLLSYSWDLDSAASYQTEVMLTALTGVAAAADSLARGGYIITAFGGDSSDGYLTVGTRVTGDTVTRGVLDNPPSGPDARRWTPVVYLRLGDGTSVHLFER